MMTVDDFFCCITDLVVRGNYVQYSTYILLFRLLFLLFCIVFLFYWFLAFWAVDLPFFCCGGFYTLSGFSFVMR